MLIKFMKENKGIENPNSKENKHRIGANFNEPPLSYDEFVGFDNNGRFIYTNFFYHFSPTSPSNYDRLKSINSELAEELATVHDKYNFYFSEQAKNSMPEDEYLEGHMLPKSILKKGYEAYLLLRDNYKNDPKLLKQINDYYQGRKKYNDDEAAFFA